jgi:hypothetical protein
VLDHSCQVGRAPLEERRGDCYDTPAVAIHALLKVERLPHVIWEPACGTGNIVAVLRQAGHNVIATDLNNRGCPDSLDRIDFLLPVKVDCEAIVTNPPFALAEKFVWDRRHNGPATIDRIQWESPYDAEDDFARSIDECYAAVKARKAAGGKGWPE